MNAAMISTAGDNVLAEEPPPRTAWISEETMCKIRERRELAGQGKYAEAATLDKEIKRRQLRKIG
eukprot:12908539-Alexandrium_andersonii.AAC.1